MTASFSSSVPFPVPAAASANRRPSVPHQTASKELPPGKIPVGSSLVSHISGVTSMPMRPSARHIGPPEPIPGIVYLVTQHAPCDPSFDLQVGPHGHLLGSTGFVDGARVSDDGTGVGGMLVAGHQRSSRPEPAMPGMPDSGSPLHVAAV